MDKYINISLSLLLLFLLIFAFKKSKINVKNQNGQIFVSLLIFTLLLFFHFCYDSGFLISKVLLLVALILNIYKIYRNYTVNKKLKA